MIRRRCAAALIIVLMSFGPHLLAYGEDAQNEGQAEPTIQDLEGELNKTLKSIKGHFEDVQDRLEEAGSDRDPGVDEAIKELEDDNQSLLETLESLGGILLKAHSPDAPVEQQSETTYEDVEDEFWKTLQDMETYIAEREEYWKEHETDPDTMLQEELEILQKEQETLEKMIEPLALALEESWKDVIAGWGDKLDEWEAFVKDLVPED